MEISYEDLKTDYCLKLYDHLEILDIPYAVVQGNMGYYLETEDLDADNIIFEKLHKSKEQKINWAKKFAKNGRVHAECFPEFESLQDLTDFIKDIFEACENSKSQSIVILPKHKTIPKIKL